MTPLPDLDTLRACDGATLTEMAWQLGLAPASVEPIDGLFWDRSAVDWWAPHLTLPEADAVWRRLRNLGWQLSNTWRPAFPPDLQGHLEAAKASLYIDVHYAAEEETMALLRCAVLALATEREKEHAT